MVRTPKVQATKAKANGVISNSKTSKQQWKKSTE
jgi:hypothetical protein